MKAILKAFFIVCLFANSLTGQLDNGTMYPKNIVGQDVISNQPIDVQQWLDDGKPVIVSFFASWSKQSWEYYESNWLNEINEEFGPNGSDQIRIVAIEGEPQNGSDQLSMEIGGVRPLKSYGDWTNMVSFPILDDASFNSAFSTDLFPITYIIRPNGVMIELNRNEAMLDKEFQMKALFPKERDIIINSNIRDASFCGEHKIPEGLITILNMGADPIENLTLDFFIGQSLIQTHNIDEVIPPLSSAQIETNEQLINSNSEVNIFVSDINSESYSIDKYNIITADVIEPALNTEKLKMEITFDKYPEETQWILMTDSGLEIGRDNYGFGEVESWGTLEYEFEIPVDVSCLNLILQDSYGDGWTKWGKDDDGNITPIPGIRFYNQYGSLIKDKHNVENSTNFKVDLESIDLYLKRDAVSSNVDLISDLSVTIYPSPARDLININGLENIKNIESLIITNNIGKLVKTIDLKSKYDVIDIYDLNSGLYYLNIITAKNSIVKTFVKK